jgi:orotate phosphoribosyltransferase
MPDALDSLLADRGAILRGHFQLASGRHGDLYIEKFRILQWPDITGQMCGRIAEHFRGIPTVVVGPTTGGIILAYETARHLGLPSLICEKREHGTGREFKRGFQLGPGDRVLVVDDVLTTGGSIRDVIDAVQERGADVAGVGVLVDRTGGTIDFGVPFFACLTVAATSWAPDDCPLCPQGIPLTVT